MVLFKDVVKNTKRREIDGQLGEKVGPSILAPPFLIVDLYVYCHRVDTGLQPSMVVP